MPDRDWRVSVTDMIVHSRYARAHVQGLDATAFASDIKAQHAVACCVEIFGEAAKHVPEAVRQRAPGVPWRGIMGARNILAHAYARVDPAILWGLGDRELSVMEDHLNALLDAPTPDGGSESR
ncbi:DUF86 domain-containing protein [Hyphomonadaceae bacterium ML37]|nr:DUF86 domain-containing protein [Hyphomonadaceae bacterium ML37]